MEPLLVTVSEGEIQFVVFKFVSCCNMKPEDGYDHETIAVFVVVSVIDNNGEPGVCTTANKLQNPPTRE